MDYQWFIDTFDDTTTITKQFTKRELAVLSTALSFLFNEAVWDGGLTDDIDAKLADIESKLDDE